MREPMQPREPDGQGRAPRDREPDEPGFKDYLATLRRRMWAVVATLVIVATIGTVRAFKATPIYEATAKILIEKQTPKALDFGAALQFDPGDRAYYKTQVELLQSRAVLDMALQEDGMDDIFVAGPGDATEQSLLGELRRTVSGWLGGQMARAPEPWERLRSSVTVSFAPDSHLLRVNAESSDRDKAAKIANAVARAFVRYHLERKLAVSDEAFTFLRQQTDELEGKLVEGQNALQEFREKANFVVTGGDGSANPLLARLTRLNEELTDVQLRRTTLETQLLVAQQGSDPSEPPESGKVERLLSLPQVREDPAIASIRTGLVQAEKELIGLSDTYGPGHPRIQTAADKVSLLRTKLSEALQHVVESLAPQVEMLRRREEELSRQYEQQSQIVLASARQTLTYERLQNEVARQSKLFDVLVDRMREVSLTADYARTNVEVVEAASVPGMAVRPRKLRIVASAALLGLALGVGLAFFAEHMDDTIQTPEDLEECAGVPMLGFVPPITTNGRGGKPFTQRSTVAVEHPASSVSEAYRSIRTNLFFSAPLEQAKALVVTSGGPGDGKTTTAANLAIVIAQSGKRVLLVDADLRRPKIRDVFRISAGTGLREVLTGKAELDEAIALKVRKNLDVLPCRPVSRRDKPDQDNGIRDLLIHPLRFVDKLRKGPYSEHHHSPSPAELFDSPQMRQLLDDLRERYDRIIIDTPPILFVTDASILAAMSDGVILVVKSGRNTRDQARRAREQLDSVNARILGGVLNDVQPGRIGRYYSRYYYYDYYGEGRPKAG